MKQILASLDDINAELPSQEDPAGLSDFVIEATDANTGLLQITVARVVRGYLSGVVDTTVSMGWDSPENTPEIIRVVAAKMIAAEVYFNSASRTTLLVAADSIGQHRYNEAMDILNKILEGLILIDGDVPIDSPNMSELDFFPVDDTDRAFTMGQQF